MCHPIITAHWRLRELNELHIRRESPYCGLWLTMIREQIAWIDELLGRAQVML